MNKKQLKILTRKILPRFILIGLIILGLIGIVVAKIYGKYLEEENEKWWNDPANKTKIEKTLKQYETKYKNNRKQIFEINNPKIRLEANEEYVYDSELFFELNLKSNYEEVIEYAEIVLKIKLEYNKGAYTLNSINERRHPKIGQFIPINGGFSSYNRLNFIIERYNVSNYFPTLNYKQIDTMDFSQNSRHYYDDINDWYREVEKDFSNNKNYEVFKKINNDHLGIWKPLETKRLRLKWKLKDLIKDSTYNSIPNINLFKVNKATVKAFLKVKNSNGFSHYVKKINSLDITNKWNSNFVQDELLKNSKENLIKFKDLDKIESKLVRNLKVKISKDWEVEAQINEKSVDLYALILINQTKDDVISIMTTKRNLNIGNLENHAKYNNDRFIRTMKNNGTNLKSIKIVNKTFKGVNAIYEYYQSTFTKTNERKDVVSINFFHKDYIYNISYSIDNSTEQIIKEITLD